MTLNNMEWVKEPIEKMKYCNWLYKIICFCIGKRKIKMTYEDMFVFFYGMYKRKYGDEKSKELALMQIIEIYKDLHDNNLPKGI